MKLVMRELILIKTRIYLLQISDYFSGNHISNVDLFVKSTINILVQIVSSLCIVTINFHHNANMSNYLNCSHFLSISNVWSNMKIPLHKYLEPTSKENIHHIVKSAEGISSVSRCEIWTERTSGLFKLNQV